jgi:hypothetical protein
MRTGSTWLHHALSGVAALPRMKETRFFRERYRDGIAWYARQFRVPVDGEPIGEIGPTYFASTDAIRRIHAHIPDCKIIVTLRDPVDRAYSYYKLMRSSARTSESFEETLVRGHGNWESNRYTFYLRKWQERFGAQHVLVNLYDDLNSDPQAYLDRICNFAAAKAVLLTERTPPPQAHNRVLRQPKNLRLATTARIFRSWLEQHELVLALKILRGSGAFAFCFERGEPFPELEPELGARVRERLRPEVDALEQMIGRDLSAWKRPPARAQDSTLKKRY